VFIGHGSPMNALEQSVPTAWSELAGHCAPRAIVCVSAHWFINASAVTAMSAPRTIHDFFGFPQPLFDMRYPAPGSPELAQQVVDTAAPIWIGLDLDSWGLDHGAWSVLARMYPAADIPVVQVSVDASKPQRHHFDIGTRLDARSETACWSCAAATSCTTSHDRSCARRDRLRLGPAIRRARAR
jgi:4,5-DOPA dioxygenase extradiol